MSGLLVDQVLRHVKTSGARPAVIAAGRTLSWHDLGEAVSSLTARLETLELRRDEPVAVLGERSVDYVIGILAVMAAGGAFVPFDPAAPVSHSQRLSSRVGIRVGVGSRTSMPHVDVVVSTTGELDVRDDGSAVRSSEPAARLAPTPPHAHADDGRTAPSGRLAYGLFTSGTTGEPHLVGVEQDSVVALVDAFEDIAPQRGPVVSTSVCPFIFDVSVWELFSALCTGGTVVILDGGESRDPARLVDAWQRHGVTTVYCPPALLDAVADEWEGRDDFSSLERLLTGVEPVTQRTLGRFLARDPKLAVVNGYGPTEATVCCTFHRLHEVEQADRRTPIGRALKGYRVRLIDPELPGGELRDVARPADGEEAKDDVGVGEILVGGVGLARGYLDDPELTRERFVWSEGERWYRTGDLGRWLPDGVIEFVGRRDHQIKVRGFRIELGDVESALLRCPGVRSAVPLAVPGPQGRRLVGFVVPEAPNSTEARPVTESSIRAWLGAHLPDHLVPSRVILVEAIPLTTNGKVDRETLIALARSRSVTTDYVAPPQGRAATIARIWSEVLGLDQVGMQDDFFDLGGDSATAVFLARRICREFGVGGHPSSLLRCGTVAEQAAVLDRVLSQDDGDSPRAEQPLPASGPVTEEDGPVTVGQEGLWIRQAADPDDLSFVLPVAIRVRGTTEAQTVAAAVDRLVAAHAALGTRIQPADQGLRQRWVQVPDTRVLDPVTEDDLPARLTERYLAVARRIATLDGPLAEAEVLPTADGDHIVLVVAHHLVLDGSSVPQLATGLAASLEGLEPTRSPSSARFALQQRALLAGATGLEAKAHWETMLAGLDKALELPLSRERTGRRQGRGAVLRRRLDTATADAMAHLSAQSGATPFATVLAAVTTVAMRFSGQDDVVVATPVAVDRAHADVADAVGYYVNLVPVRCRANEATTYGEVLSQVSDCLDHTRAYGWFPFEEMLSLVDGSRSAAAERLARLVVAQDVPPGLPLRTGNLELAEQVVDSGLSKYELSVFVREAAGGRHDLVWEYDTDLFDHAGVERIATAVEDILRERYLSRSIWRLPMLDDVAPLVAAVNRTTTDHSDAESVFPEAPALPLRCSPDELTELRLVRREARFDAAVWNRLKRRASEGGLTPSVLLCAAYAENLSVWTESPRFSLNLPAFNRVAVHEEVSEVIGDFTSVLLLEVDCAADVSFRQRAQKVQQQMWDDVAALRFSGVRLMRAIAAHRGEQPSMPYVFTSLIFPGAAERSVVGRLGNLVEGISQTPQVWLDCQVFEDGGDLVVNWDSIQDLFDPVMLDGMFEEFVRLVHLLADDDEAWESTQWREERARRLISPARTAANETYRTQTEVLLHQGFLRKASDTPDALAVVAEDMRLTYAQLDTASRWVATALRQQGAQAGDRVVVTLPKGWQQVAAVLGVLRAGMTYVPVDPALPRDRAHTLFDISGARHAVSSPALGAALEWPEGVAPLALSEQAVRPGDATSAWHEAEIDPASTAYIIFTSGTTGVPKGVVTAHKAAANTIEDINDRFQVTSDDRVFGLSSLSFDLSVYDIFGALAAGGCLVLPPEGQTGDPACWEHLIRQEGVTVWNSVPALMDLLVSHLELSGADPLPRVRLVLLSGDWIPMSLPERMTRVVPAAVQVSLGGATEASIWSISHVIEKVEPWWRSIPYGTALANQTFEVLDAHLRPRPDLVAGELYIGGAGLAEGYVGNQEETAYRFVAHPSGRGRLYRTGDLGRWLPSGEIEFLGRTDTQVKINGFRVEIGEIEKVISELEAVANCAVVMTSDDHGARRLVAYVCTAPGASLDTETVRAHAARKLPAYMVPATCVLLEELPLSGNGKVDRARLPAVNEIVAADERQGPKTPTEQAVNALWSAVLGHENFGVTDTFFAVGGDSRQLTELVLRIRASLLPGFPLRDVFQGPSVRALAQLLDEKQHNGPARTDHDDNLRDQVAQRVASRTRRRR